MTVAEVEQVIREMGPVEGDSRSPGSAESGSESSGGTDAAQGRGAPKGTAARRHLYQIREGAMVSGVCSGIAAYFDVGVTVVRMVLVLLAIITWGLWVLAYLVMMFVIPCAETSEQRAAAHGWPFNAEELIGRARRHYAQSNDGRRWRCEECAARHFARLAAARVAQAVRSCAVLAAPGARLSASLGRGPYRRAVRAMRRTFWAGF